MSKEEELREALDRCLHVLKRGLVVRMMEQWPALEIPVKDAIEKAEKALFGSNSKNYVGLYVVIDEEILGVVFPNGIQILRDHPRFCGSNRAMLPHQDCRPATKKDFEKFQCYAPPGFED